MRLLRVLPDRHRKLARELVAFSFAGAVNTAFGFVLFNLLFSMGSLTANAISTAGATATSFVLNRHITYRHRPRRSLRHELPLFAVVNLIGLGIQQGLMALAKVAFDLQDTDRLEFNLARVVSVAVGTVFLLLSYRSLVFRKAKDEVLPVDAPVSPVAAPATALSASTAPATTWLAGSAPATALSAGGAAAPSTSSANGHARPVASESDEFNELTVPLEVELSHDLDLPTELALDDLVPAETPVD